MYKPSFIHPKKEENTEELKILIMVNLVSDSGASRMDYSARGDFPSIAVSINPLPQPTIHHPQTTIRYPQSIIHYPPPTIHNLQTTIYKPQPAIRITLRKPLVL